VTRPTGATFRLVVERDHGRCAACGKDVWGVRSFDYSLHHRHPAGMGGDRRPEIHLAGNLVLLHGSGTTSCHGAVEANRADAYLSGLLVRRGFTPCRQPIQHAVHGLVLLSDDGSWGAAAELPEVIGGQT